MSFLGPEVVNYWQPSKAKPSKKRIRRGKTVGKTLPEDIAQPLSEANLCYISGDYTRAIELLSTVTSLAPRLADPYYTMGMIYYHYENYLQSLQFFVIAASYTPKTKMWILVALLAASLKQWNQGIEAIIRYSKIESNSYLQSLRILLNLEKKQYTYSRSLLGKYLESFPNDIAFLIEYGDTLYVKHVYDKALNAYVQYVCYIIGTDNITNEKEKLLRTCSICLSTPCKSFFLESYTNAINACLDPTIEVTHDNDCKTCQEYIELYFYCIHQIYIILIERYHDLEQMITQTDAVIAMFQTIPKSDRDNRLLNSDGIIHEIMKIDLNRALNEVNIIANAILIAVQSFESQLNDLHASLTKWITPQQMSQHENFLGSPPVSPFDVNMLKNIMLLTSGDDDEVNGSIHHLRSCLVVLDEESKIAVVDSTGAGSTTISNCKRRQ
jgi:tetratricopeptide (TPR) repeat protein